MKNSKNPTYALGHADYELDRLIKQSAFFGELTSDLFHLAGLAPGMTVLDAGCGVGDVSFLAARFVGTEGHVIGVDKSAEAIAVATKRAADAGITNVSFVQSDINELALETLVDALVGRLVLMYFAEPATELRQLTRFVQSPGLVIFQELDISLINSVPTSPLFELTIKRINETLIAAGADVRMGMKLAQTFQDAGLPTPKMRLMAHVENGSEMGVHLQGAAMTRTLLPLMERFGVATAAEVDIDTLAERIRADALTHNSTLLTPPFVGAWTWQSV